MFIEAPALASPRVRAAVRRHIAEGLALVPLLDDDAELMAVAGGAPFTDTPAWPAADTDEVSEAQLLALVAAADRREVARALVMRRTEAHSASMLPGPRSH